MLENHLKHKLMDPLKEVNKVKVKIIVLELLNIIQQKVHELIVNEIHFVNDSLKKFLNKKIIKNTNCCNIEGKRGRN